MAIKIEKTPNGTYNVRVWSKILDAFGNRKNKYKSGFKSVMAARRWAELTEDELTELSEVDFVDKDFSFNELQDLYMQASKTSMEPTTIEYLEKNILPRTKEFFKQMKAKHINSRFVQQFVDYLATIPNKNKPGATLKAGTIKRYLSHVNAVINWAVSQDYLEYNRIKRIKLPKDDEEFEPTILTSAEAGQILAWLKKNYYNLYIPVLLSVTMSPRRGEFTALTWDKIDFENDTIDFSENRVTINNEVQNKKRMKTKTSKRVLVMSDFVKNELLEHKEMNKHLNSNFVCANIFTGDTPTKPTYITHAFHDVMKENFGIDIRVHDLRHSFNMIAYEEADVDETTRFKIMGHSNPKITRQVYTRDSLKKNKNASNLIAAEIEKNFNKKRADL